MTVQSNVNNQQLPVYEPVQIFDGVAPTLPRFVGTTLTFTDINAPIWRIQKYWDASGVTVSGFAEGTQEFVYAWSGRTGYTYK